MSGAETVSAERGADETKVALIDATALVIKDAHITLVTRGRTDKIKIGLADFKSYDLRVVNRKRAAVVWTLLGLASVCLLLFALTPLAALNIFLSALVAITVLFLLIDAFIVGQTLYSLQIYGQRRAVIRATVASKNVQKLRATLSELVSTAKSS